jgi:membrane associated rhomboid family serine protease
LFFEKRGHDYFEQTFMRITYNAPFTLTFTFLAGLVLAVDHFTTGTITREYFTLHPVFLYNDPLSYFRLFSHTLGHADLTHFTGNFTLILLLGPILEEKYGTSAVFFMAMATALFTALLNLFLFPNYLLGASGIVFMMILLVSFANVKKGEIPLTFFLVLVVFLGTELLNAMQINKISELAHIVGGICGSIFGFLKNK